MNHDEWRSAHPEHEPDPRVGKMDVFELTRRIASGYYTASKSAVHAARDALANVETLATGPLACDYCEYPYMPPFSDIGLSLCPICHAPHTEGEQ